MTNALLKFWDEAPLNTAPYVHPKDRIPQNHVQSGVSSYAEYVRAFENDTLKKAAFHLSLLPQPYFGDLENAEIVILTINPGLSACDYYAEENSPEFKNELIASIRQEKREHIFLDPKWAWTGGFTWWERKLREVAKLIATEKYAGHYGRALKNLASRTATIELVPYHSTSFGSSKQLESARAARNFIKSLGVDRTVIATRSVASWELPDTENIIKYPREQALSASLGATTIGGKAILRRYGTISS